MQRMAASSLAGDPGGLRLWASAPPHFPQGDRVTVGEQRVCTDADGRNMSVELESS